MHKMMAQLIRNNIDNCNLMGIANYDHEKQHLNNNRREWITI